MEEPIFGWTLSFRLCFDAAFKFHWDSSSYPDLSIEQSFTTYKLSIMVLLEILPVVGTVYRLGSLFCTNHAGISYIAILCVVSFANLLFV